MRDCVCMQAPSCSAYVHNWDDTANLYMLVMDHLLTCNACAVYEVQTSKQRQTIRSTHEERMMHSKPAGSA